MITLMNLKSRIIESVYRLGIERLVYGSTMVVVEEQGVATGGR